MMATVDPYQLSPQPIWMWSKQAPKPIFKQLGPFNAPLDVSLVNNPPLGSFVCTLESILTSKAEIVVYISPKHPNAISILKDMFGDKLTWHVHTKLSTIELAKLTEIDEDIVFFSDSGDNMQQQMSWVKEINPVLSSLEFRLPQPVNKLPSVYVDKHEYLTGSIAVVPYDSSVSRLIVTRPSAGKYPTSFYSSYSHQSDLFYHNTITRTTKQYKVEGKTYNYDRSRLMSVIHRYIGEYTVVDNADDLVESILDQLSK